MTIGGSWLAHGEKYAATVDDRGTVRRIRDALTAAIQEHEQIAATIEDADARTDFNETFEDDLRRCQAVIETCNNRIQAWRRTDMTHQATIWVAATYEDTSHEIGTSLHRSEDDAKCAIMNELHELYGDTFDDYPPPDEYDVAAISSWLSENLIRFSWTIRQMKIPT